MTQRLPLSDPSAGPEDAFAQALAAHRAGRTAEALRLYDRAIREGRNPAGAYTNIGVVLRRQRRFEAAIVAHRRALELSPDDPGILGNLGNALKDAGRFEEAIRVKRRVVELAGPEDAEALHGLGIALRDAGRIEAAADAFEAALRLAPDDAEIRFNLALAQLHLERFEAGWANYETRWRLDRQKKRAFRQPWWRGEPFPGRTLLLFAEQGFGDTIQFIRFVGEAKARGGTVLLECQPELERLMASVAGLDGILVRDTDAAAAALARADLVCPLASLPGHCGVTLESLPGRVPYLAPPPGPWPEIEALVARSGDRLKVGIVWSGSVTFADNANRSAGLEPYLRFAEVPGVQLYGLQKGPRLAELEALGTDSLIIDASAALDDFAATAALIQRLDLVLMTDSSVAHLAGALGRPVWVLLMHQPDWRWLRERPDSPWYPSARLVRQRTPRDWEGVFAEAAAALAGLARDRPRAAPPVVGVATAARGPVIELELAPTPEPDAPPAPPAPPAADLLLPAAFRDAAGAPRFVMPIPRALLDDPGLRVLVREEQTDGGFEYATRRFLDEHLAPGDLFVDVGAHWGIHALTAATRHPGQVRVLAIEPAPLNVRHLRSWIAQNRLEEAIEVIAAGAADRTGFATLAPQSTMGHHLEALSAEAAGQGVRVPVTTLDRLLDDRPELQDRRTLVKIDVEGLEPEVVAGAGRLLASGGVQAVIFERGRNYDPPAGRRRWLALLDRFQDLGFELWRMPHENLGGPLVPYAPNANLLNVYALPRGFARRPDYAKPFGSLPPPFRLPRAPGGQETIAATKALIRARTADVERWAVPERDAAARRRARLAAALIPPGAAVVDLGAGAMLLCEELAPGCRYLPVDLFRFAPDTALLDLERADLAALGRFDVAAALAVLEHLHDPGRFLGGLAALAPLAILTYPLAAPGEGTRRRRERGLVNDLDAAALARLLAATGWQERHRTSLADGAVLLALARG